MSQEKDWMKIPNHPYDQVGLSQKILSLAVQNIPRGYIRRPEIILATRQLLLQPQLSGLWTQDGLNCVQILVCELFFRTDGSAHALYVMSFNRLCRTTKIDLLTMPVINLLFSVAETRKQLLMALGVVSLAWQVHAYPDELVYDLKPSGLVALFVHDS